MNLAIYIAKRLKGDATSVGRVSRLGTIIATVSVGISIFVMILSVSIIRGFRDEIENKAAGFTGHILMEAPGAGFITDPVPMSTQLSYFQSLPALQQIDHIQEFAIAPGLIKTESALQGVSLKGVGPSFRWNFFKENLKEGKLPSLNDSVSSSEILISFRLAGLLNLHTNDIVTMYFIGENVRMRRFVISGIYDAQLEDIDNHLILGDIRHARKLNGWSDDQVSGVELFLKDSRNIEKKQEQIEEYIIRNTSDTDQGVVLRNIRKIYAHLYDWLDLMDINVAILLTLMILVGGFNMISGLLIMLVEKTSMIGLFKSMGMKDRQVRMSFLAHSFGIALRGVIWGTVLAVIFCIVQGTTHFLKLNPASYFVSSVPVSLIWWHVVLVDILGIAAIMLLVQLPLRGIVRVSPDKAIRMN